MTMRRTLCLLACGVSVEAMPLRSTRASRRVSPGAMATGQRPLLVLASTIDGTGRGWWWLPQNHSWPSPLPLPRLLQRLAHAHASWVLPWALGKCVRQVHILLRLLEVQS